MISRSETAPTQGTLQVFPDVLLSNAYFILRPFFKLVSEDPATYLDAPNWKFGESLLLHDLTCHSLMIVLQIYQTRTSLESTLWARQLLDPN